MTPKHRIVIESAEVAVSKLIALPDADAHHLTRVLRLRQGDCVVVVDKSGASAVAKLVETGRGGVELEVEYMLPVDARAGIEVDLAVAVPKGGRADFMVEKLAELGARRLIPLATERSVVTPREGSAKVVRWRRLAKSAAQQSVRSRVMEVGEPSTLDAMLADRGSGPGYNLAVFGDPGAKVSLLDVVDELRKTKNPGCASMLLLVGPEGGFTAAEMDMMAARGCRGACISDGVLRVETAAIAMAALTKSRLAFMPESLDIHAS